MKQFLLLIIILEIVLIHTDIQAENQKTRAIPNFMKKIKQKIKNLQKVEVRHLQTNVTDDVYDTSSDSTEDIDTSSPNGTSTDEPTTTPTEVSTVATTTRPNVITPPAKPLSLYGFGGFKQPIASSPLVTWNTYFRYYSGPKPKVITYIIYITIYIRRLEEKRVPKEVNCTLKGDLNDYLQYDCNTTLDEGVKLDDVEKISVDPTFTFDGVKQEKDAIEIKEEAETAMENLSEQKEDKYEVLVDSTKTFIEMSSTNNKIESDYSAKKFNINGLNFYIVSSSNAKLRQLQQDMSGKYTFSFYNQYESKKRDENVACSINKNEDGTTYNLECNPDVPFIANINDGIGNGDDEDIKSNTIQLALADDYVNLSPNTTTTSNHNYYRKNSSGLSGGAIAGIVIVCIVALVAVSLLVLMLRKKGQTTIPQDSTQSIFNMNSV